VLRGKGEFDVNSEERLPAFHLHLGQPPDEWAFR
jgi:hypothetical protein